MAIYFLLCGKICILRTCKVNGFKNWKEKPPMKKEQLQSNDLKQNEEKLRHLIVKHVPILSENLM